MKNRNDSGNAASMPRRNLAIVALALASLCALPALAKTCGAELCVGPNSELKRPSEAAAIAKDGDRIHIAAGVYENDVAVFRQNNLTIRGVGGYAHLSANGNHAEGKAIWVIKGNNTTIEHVEFSGARVPHMNGAGIRQEGAGLTLRHCYFHDNETGLLTGTNAQSDIVIENSEFFGSGAPRGNPHAIYIGEVRSFTLKFSYAHHARVGHNVKSRAYRNNILYNRIMDEADGASSYAIDLPNGGIAFVIGNVIQQGPRTRNDAIVAFGAERLKQSHDRNELYFAWNTVVNDSGIARFLYSPYATDAMVVINNIFSGPGRWFVSSFGEALPLASGKQGNIELEKSQFEDAAAFDYRLRPQAAARGAAITAAEVRGTALTPTFQYVHKASGIARSHANDAGALEFNGR